MNKVIICVFNPKNKGKTSSLRELANLICNTYNIQQDIYGKPINIPVKGDFRLIIQANIRGKNEIIGIESLGDTQVNMDEFANKNCDVIFCTSRTKGSSINNIHRFAKAHKYSLIRNSSYIVDNSNQQHYQIVNNIKANHLLDLLKNI